MMKIKPMTRENAESLLRMANPENVMEYYETSDHLIICVIRKRDLLEPETLFYESNPSTYHQLPVSGTGGSIEAIRRHLFSTMLRLWQYKDEAAEEKEERSARFNRFIPPHPLFFIASILVILISTAVKK